MAVNGRIPTRRLDITDPERANIEILEFAAALVIEGERPWFEVWYPAPVTADADLWDEKQPDTFDAVEVIDGQIMTLPPYKDMEVRHGRLA